MVAQRLTQTTRLERTETDVDVGVVDQQRRRLTQTTRLERTETSTLRISAPGISVCANNFETTWPEKLV